jgi:hypothetical protein
MEWSDFGVKTVKGKGDMRVYQLALSGDEQDDYSTNLTVRPSVSGFNFTADQGIIIRRLLRGDQLDNPYLDQQTYAAAKGVQRESNQNLDKYAVSIASYPMSEFTGLPGRLTTTAKKGRELSLIYPMNFHHHHEGSTPFAHETPESHESVKPPADVMPFAKDVLSKAEKGLMVHRPSFISTKPVAKLIQIMIDDDVLNMDTRKYEAKLTSSSWLLTRTFSLI